jgi:LmbE family N-acetylglucosaminyl deacetylase/glycosyltransferase involved in cell wall biosynthesis
MESGLIPYNALRSIPSSRVLVFAPHPDDEVFGCGGLLAAYQADRVPVDVVVVTSGDFGEHGRDGAAARENESRAAADVLGVGSVSFWREPDRGVRFNERTVEAAREAISQSGADLVLAPSVYEIHPDHRSVAWIVIEAARRLVDRNRRLRVALYEVGTPLHRVDVLVDISQWAQAKRAAAACFQSQLALQEYDEQTLALNRFRAYTLGSEVNLAEAYRLLDADALSQPVWIADPESDRQERLSLASTRSDQEKVAVLIRSMGRPTLARAVASVALQTYPNVEIWVLNAKGPGHADPGDRAGSFPLHYIDQERSIPRSEAANVLLDAAEGDFAIFLDDDDWYAPDHVARLVNVLRTRPDAVASFSGVEFGEMDGEQWRPEHRFDAPYDSDRLLFENYLPMHAVLFRLELARGAGGCRFDSALQMFEDWDFWLQLAERGDLLRAEGVSAYYLRNRADGSRVFDEQPAQDASREQLFTKWFGRNSYERYRHLLDYTKALLRENAIARSREAETGAQVAGWKSIIAARELEIGNLRTNARGLQEKLVARLEELANLGAHANELQRILAARREEIVNLNAHTRGLQDIIAAREQEIANAGKHVEGLKEIIAARDEEIRALRLRIGELEAGIAKPIRILARKLTGLVRRPPK